MTMMANPEHPPVGPSTGSRSRQNFIAGVTRGHAAGRERGPWCGSAPHRRAMAHRRRIHASGAGVDRWEFADLDSFEKIIMLLGMFD